MSEYTTSAFSFRDADDTAYAELYDLIRRMHAERLPEDPPPSLALVIHRARNLPTFIDAHAWLVKDRGAPTPVAFAALYVPQVEENRHLAQATLDVHPEHRRKGIGATLARRIARTALGHGRRSIIADTYGRVAAGASFMASLRATRGVEAHTNQLDLERIDRSILEAWRKPRGTTGAEFDLNLWDGAYPDEELESIAKLHDVMNAQPRDGLDIEDDRMTPQRLRELEAFFLAGGTKRWTIYARHLPSGAFAGFTEVMLEEERPTIAQQGNTGVVEEYRGQGLGKRLKAEMLERLLLHAPNVRFVRTSNADSNDAMVRINRALGFTGYSSTCTWQWTIPPSILVETKTATRVSID